jgi:hypothetical protein
MIVVPMIAVRGGIVVVVGLKDDVNEAIVVDPAAALEGEVGVVILCLKPSMLMAMA